ncbi:hypothetical protein BKA70DRAFT_1422715 [Coprinopsis sp. MPI-PUGE-AT-0042]|nr:hypothetical protein BKA70DRAFT_1422715 [Coprinopsis sp. MPI-PUGE-AT-0042]
MTYIQGRCARNLSSPVEKALVALPEELITMVMMDLDIKSLLRLRATCRSFNRISRGRQVWRNLFLNNLGTTIPRPFFLSKPLSDCMADDIEADLRRWETGWGPPTRQPRIVKRGVDSVGDVPPCLARARAPTLCLLPGGRWLLAGYADGSVWSFDLSDSDTCRTNVKRRLLVPSPFKDTEHENTKIQLQVAVDFSSPEALGDSLGTHVLQQFNIAVIACPEDWGLASTQVDVWRIYLPPHSAADSELRLGDRLSSFTEIGTAQLGGCSLLGPVVAYSLGFAPVKCVVVVPWLDANGKAKTAIKRRYLPHLSFDKIVLLPGDRIFAVGEASMVHVYDWARDFICSTLQPHEQQLSRIGGWCDTAPERINFGVSQPMVIGGTVRIVVPSSRYLHGYQIPLEGYIKETTSVCLKKNWFSPDVAQAYGYHRGIGLRHVERMLSSEYRWPDEVAVPNTRPVTCIRHHIERLGDGCRRLFMDQYSNRVVIVESSTSQFFFVSFIT